MVKIRYNSRFLFEFIQIEPIFVKGLPAERDGPSIITANISRQPCLSSDLLLGVLVQESFSVAHQLGAPSLKPAVFSGSVDL